MQQRNKIGWSGQKGVAITHLARLLLATNVLLLLALGGSFPSLAQSPFGESPQNFGEGASPNDGLGQTPEIQDILDAALDAMPGDYQEGWGRGTVATLLPDPNYPGSLGDMLFVAWVDTDVAGLENRMAAADGDRETIITRWGGIEVLDSRVGQMNDLAWRWAEGDLALGIEVRTLAEDDVTEPYIVSIADAMHAAAAGGSSSGWVEPDPDDDILISLVIGLLVALGAVGLAAWLVSRLARRLPKASARARRQRKPPAELVRVDALGRTHRYERDEQGRYINPLTGGELNEAQWQDYNRHLVDNRNFSDRERKKLEARDTPFDREMDDLVEKQKQMQRDLEVIQRLERDLIFNPARSGLWQGAGEPGDIMTNLKQLREQLDRGETADRCRLEAIKRLHRNHTQGSILMPEDMPSDWDYTRDLVNGTLESTLREVITQRAADGSFSWKAMGVRLLANTLTLGKIELVLTPLESAYTMHDYVQQGGDSAWEGFKQATGDVLKGEAMSFLGSKIGSRLKGKTPPLKVKPQLPRTRTPKIPGPSRYVPAKGVNIAAHMTGMPEANIRHAQRVAQKHNVRILVRPTNPEARRLLEKGLGAPKPMMIKNKTINELDTFLGANADDMGKVGHFKPKLPPKNSVPPELYEKVKDRWMQRAKEFRNQAKEVADLQAKGKLIEKDGVLYQVLEDGTRGKPYCGDHDIFDVLDAHGRPCPEPLKNHVVKDLHKPPFSAQHFSHMEWDYSHYDRMPGAGGAQSKYDIAKGIDSKIRQSHGVGGEPLIEFGPGTIDSVQGAYYTGG